MNPPPTAAAGVTTVHRVLLVDDDRRVLELMEFALGQEGFQVFAAHDGDEALRQARLQRPDLVVLDVRLPRRSGYEVCEALRREPEIGSLPIVLVSSAGEPEARLQAFERGADDFIPKPFSPKEMIARLRRLLVRADELREARSRVHDLEREQQRQQEEARRLHQETRREQRLRDLAFGFGVELQRSLDLDDIAGRLLAAVQTRLGAGMAALLLPDPAEGAFVPHAVRGDGFERVAALSVARHGELAALLAGLGRPVTRRDLERFPELRDELPPLVAHGVAMIAPLRGAGGLDGLLVADEGRRSSEPTAADTELLAGLCDLAAVAIANAGRLRDQAAGLLEMLAGESDDDLGPELREESLAIAAHATRASLLPPRQRLLVLWGVRLGRWGLGVECGLHLGRLAERDPTGLFEELQRVLARAERIREPALELDPATERTARLLAVCLEYGTIRRLGVPMPSAVANALAEASARPDAATQQALLAAAREVSEAMARRARAA
jgi:DNA-binding response OmpR family regulator